LVSGPLVCHTSAEADAPVGQAGRQALVPLSPVEMFAVAAVAQPVLQVPATPELAALAKVPVPAGQLSQLPLTESYVPDAHGVVARHLPASGPLVWAVPDEQTPH
jgi:hypothetical protein